MIKKLKEKFKGDRKYFTIVFFILALIIAVGLITPMILESKRNNWNSELTDKILEIENGVKSNLASKELDLVNVKNKVKKELHNTLTTSDYEYGKLKNLVNDNVYNGYSVEIIAPNGKIIAWNKILAVEQNDIFPFVYPINEVHFFNSPLITYLTIIDTVLLHSDRFYIIFSKTLEKNYSLQNKYFINTSFSEELSEKFNTLFNVYYDPYAASPKDGRKHSVILTNLQNSKIGLVSFFKPTINLELSEIQNDSTRLQILLLVIGLIFLTLGLKSDFKSIKWKSLKIFTLILYLTLVRLVFFLAGFPSRYIDGALVDPALFSSTLAWGIVKSPIEFLVTNIFLIIIAVCFFLYILDYYKEKNSGRFQIIKFVISPAILVLTFYMMRGLSASIKSVIFDSTIRYFKAPDLIPSIPTLLMNFNILLLGFASLMVIIALILLAIKFLKVNQGKQRILKFSIFFLVVQGFCYVFFLRQSEPLLTYFMYFLFFTFIFIVIANLVFRDQPVSLNLVYSSLISSVIVISMLNYFNLELEKRSLKVIAYEVNRASKELISYLVDETLRNSSQNEKLTSSLYRLNSNFDSEAFIAWSKSSLQRESLSSELVIFDRNFNQLGKFTVGFDESVNYKKLFEASADSNGNSIEIKLPGEVGVGFAGVVQIQKDNIPAGYIGVAAKFTVENLGAAEFPDFLESNKAALGSVVDLKLVKIFEFSDGKLLHARGDIFPSKELREQIFNAELTIYGDGWANLDFYDENFIAFILKNKLSGTERTTVVAIKDKEINWSLYNFFKIFIIHSIFILLFVISLIALRYLRLKYSFRMKLLLAFLLVSILPVVALAIYNRQVVQERTSSAIFNELNKRSEYLENHISAQLAKHPEREIQNTFENANKELKIAFTVYENSEEFYSSQSEYYKNKFLSDKLNPSAHYNLNYLSYREQLTDESIDNYYYHAYYKKIEFTDRYFIVGVNDAFNRIELSYSPVDADVFLFGIYAFAVIFITLLSTVFANQISSPIRQLTRATNAVAQGDLNIQLENREKGEMKELVDGFNSMTNELQKNHREIAELEREIAWKEMAKQVAHEIKNPLTPMKLSVQQLVAAYNDKRTEFDEILKKLSSAILNQIDNLSLIATEFSAFAKMPSLKLEKFNLIIVIKETVHLFSEEVTLDFNSDVEELLVESDNSQMRRMFINLIRNSIQAKATIITINLSIDESYAIIDISDNGTGIKKENQNRIFETNFTTKEKGLGLGLKLIKRFLENTGGEITLHDSSNSNTVFRIKIPTLQA